MSFTLDAATIVRPLSSGAAMYVTDTLTVGTHPVSALYGGDANFTTRTGTLAAGKW